jgi:tRNA A37 threonylcarbamoyladenosine modification protein TsaB
MLDRFYSIACETITKDGSISALNGLDLILNLNFVVEKSLSREFTDNITLVRTKCSIKLSDLTYLSIATGPGSFTSIRVAISTFSGLARSLNIPLIGVSFREIIRDFAYGEGISICILAGKTQIVFAKGTDIVETIDLAELKRRILLDANGEFRLDDSLFDIVKTDLENLPENVRRLDNICDAVGRIAWRKFQAGDLTTAIPEYLELQNAK